MKQIVGSLIAGLLLSFSAWAGVDLNTATLSELEAVKGIGPAKARAIVEHRARHGPFKRVDDLAAVKGFGKASVTKLKGKLAVGSEAASPAKK